MNWIEIPTNQVRVFFDGAWVKKTQGGGQDDIYLQYGLSASWGAPLTRQYMVGRYNDRGGPAAQEVMRVPIGEFLLVGQEWVTIVFALFGVSQGDLLSKIFDIGRTFVDTATGQGDEFVLFLLSKWLNTPDVADGYVGSVVLELKATGSNTILWRVRATDPAHSTEMGLTPTGSMAVELCSSKHSGIYQPKVLVLPERPVQTVPGHPRPLPAPGQPLARPAPSGARRSPSTVMRMDCSFQSVPAQPLSIAFRESNQTGQVVRESYGLLTPEMSPEECLEAVEDMAAIFGWDYVREGTATHLFWRYDPAVQEWYTLPAECFAVTVVQDH